MWAFLIIYMCIFSVVLKKERGFKREEVTFRYDSAPGHWMVGIYFAAAVRACFRKHDLA